MAKTRGRPFRKHDKPVHHTSSDLFLQVANGILCKLAGGELPDPPPSAEERRAEIERCLGLKAGDLSPELVERRQREHERRIQASIDESINELLPGRRKSVGN